MLRIAGDDITLTRGDSLQIQLVLTKGGEAYTPENGDVIEFHASNVFKDQPGYVLIINKVLDNSTLILELDPSDTSNVALSRMNYEFELTYADGSVDTFQQGFFYLTGECG